MTRLTVLQKSLSLGMLTIMCVTQVPQKKLEKSVTGYGSFGKLSLTISKRLPTY